MSWQKTFNSLGKNGMAISYCNVFKISNTAQSCQSESGTEMSSLLLVEAGQLLSNVLICGVESSVDFLQGKNDGKKLVRKCRDNIKTEKKKKSGKLLEIIPFIFRNHL